MFLTYQSLSENSVDVSCVSQGVYTSTRYDLMELISCTAPRWGEVEDVHVSLKFSRQEVFLLIQSQLPVGLCFFLRTFNDISVTAMLCYHLQRSKNGLRK